MQKISDLYRVLDGTLPYKNMGEGHYKKIHFKCTLTNKLILLEKQNYDSFKSDVFIASIPLELFDNEIKLKEFVNNYLIVNEENIEKSKQRSIDKKKKQLQEQLDKLSPNNQT